MITENNAINGALLFCCYGESAAISAVHQHLLKSDSWNQKGQVDWRLESAEAAHQCLSQLPGLHQTDCLQIAINRKGVDLLTGWQDARTQLEAWLPMQLLTSKGIFGTTLIYQADCDAALLGASVKVARPLIKAARLLHGVTERRIAVKGGVLGGFGRVSHIPQDTPQMVYLILSKPHHDELTDWLMHAGELFCSADATAHRGYALYRAVQRHRKTIAELIRMVETAANHLATTPDAELLAFVDRRYRQLLALAPLLERIARKIGIERGSLARLGEEEAAWLWGYHGRQLESLQTTLAHAYQDASGTLQATRTALEWHKSQTRVNTHINIIGDQNTIGDNNNRSTINNEG